MIVWSEVESAYGLYERGADRLTWYGTRATAEAAAHARASGREPDSRDRVYLPAYYHSTAFVVCDYV